LSGSADGAREKRIVAIWKVSVEGSEIDGLGLDGLGLDGLGLDGLGLDGLRGDGLVGDGLWHDRTGYDGLCGNGLGLGLGSKGLGADGFRSGVGPRRGSYLTGCGCIVDRGVEALAGIVGIVDVLWVQYVLHDPCCQIFVARLLEAMSGFAEPIMCTGRHRAVRAGTEAIGPVDHLTACMLSIIGS
jgi:hypothetical protein